MVIYAWEPRDGDTGRNIVKAKSPLSSVSLSLSHIYPPVPSLFSSLSSLFLPGPQCLSYSLIFSLAENALTPDLSKLHIID